MTGRWWLLGPSPGWGAAFSVPIGHRGLSLCHISVFPPWEPGLKGSAMDEEEPIPCRRHWLTVSVAYFCPKGFRRSELSYTKAGDMVKCKLSVPVRPALLAAAGVALCGALVPKVGSGFLKLFFELIGGLAR